MCLLLTLIASLFSIVAWLFKKVAFGKNDRSLLAVSGMLWSAEAMWCAMGAFSKLSGGNFLEMTAKDAALGVIVIVAAIAMYFFFQKLNAKRISSENQGAALKP